MSLTIETKVGKKNTLYLPKAVVEATGLKEGERVLLRVDGRTVVLEALKDPLDLALSGEKFASVTPEEVEAMSLEVQRGNVESTP